MNGTRTGPALAGPLRSRRGSVRANREEGRRGVSEAEAEGGNLPGRGIDGGVRGRRHHYCRLSLSLSLCLYLPSLSLLCLYLYSPSLSGSFSRFLSVSVSYLYRYLYRYLYSVTRRLFFSLSLALSLYLYLPSLSLSLSPIPVTISISHPCHYLSHYRASLHISAATRRHSLGDSACERERERER